MTRLYLEVRDRLNQCNHFFLPSVLFNLGFFQLSKCLQSVGEVFVHFFSIIYYLFFQTYLKKNRFEISELKMTDKAGKTVLHRYMRIPQPDDRVMCEYLWVDGSGEGIRTKCRTLDFEPKHPKGETGNMKMLLVYSIHCYFFPYLLSLHLR